MKSMHKQNGVSLVEILVAMTLSLFLLAGVLNIFISNKQAFRLNSAYGELQENSRFMSDYLPRVLRLSGYRTPPSDAMFPKKDIVFPATAPHLEVSNNSGTNGSDVLTVRYQGSGNGAGTADGMITDCLNQGVDANTVVTNVFSINANLELQCQANNPTAGGISTQVLVPGVESMQVLYGEDLDGDKQADRYVPPNFAGLDINNVVSMRMSLLVRTSDEIYKTVDSKTYNLLGTTFDPTDDFRIRKVITFTVHLRNVLSS